MGVTARGYPFPEPTDPVAQGADAIRALAEAVDTRSGTTATGVAQAVFANSSASTPLDVTLPAGRFAVTPSVVGTTEDAQIFAACYNRTTTRFRILLRQYTATPITGTKPASWIASSAP